MEGVYQGSRREIGVEAERADWREGQEKSGEAQRK